MLSGLKVCVAQASQISCGEIQTCFQGPGVNLPHSAPSSDGRWVNLLNLQVISGWFQRFWNQNSIPAGSSQGEFTRPLQLCLGVMSRFVWEGFDIQCFFPEIQGMKSKALWLNTFWFFHIHTLASQFIASSMWTIFISDKEQVEHVVDEFQMMEDHKLTAELNTSSPQVCLVSLAGGDETQKAATRLLLPWNQKASQHTRGSVRSRFFRIGFCPVFALVEWR